MRSGGKGPLVTLLEVKLGAEATALIFSGIGVAVEVAVGVIEAAIFVPGRHLDGVESVEASAFVHAHISGPLNGVTEELRRPEVRIFLIKRNRIDDVPTAILFAGVDVFGRGACIRGDVLGQFLTVDGDLDLSEVRGGLGRGVILFDLAKEPVILFGLRTGSH